MPTTLLKPTGSYIVGHIDIEFNSPTTTTTLLARVFYPSKLLTNNDSNATSSSSNMELIVKNFDTWIPSLAYYGGYGKPYGLPSILSIPAMRLMIGDLRLCSTYGLPLLNLEQDNNGSTLPVVIFSHGLYGNRTTYSIVCCEFASRGWCVFSLEHHDGSASHSIMRGVPFPYVSLDKNKIDEFEMRNKQLETRTLECLGMVELGKKLNSGVESLEANLLNNINSHRDKNGKIQKDFFKVYIFLIFKW
jgi:hypothetical protein